MPLPFDMLHRARGPGFASPLRAAARGGSPRTAGATAASSVAWPGALRAAESGSGSMHVDGLMASRPDLSMMWKTLI